MIMELTVFSHKWQETVNIIDKLMCGKVQGMDLVSVGTFLKIVFCVSWLKWRTEAKN
jgi:hypothetical protein